MRDAPPEYPNKRMNHQNNQFKDVIWWIADRTLKPVMFSRYGKAMRKIFLALRPWCRPFPNTIVILSDGTVTTCCNDMTGENKLGSVYENDISEIWEKKAKPILFGDLYDLKKCKECIGGRYARLISRKASFHKWQDYARGYPKTIQIEIMGRCNYGCCWSTQISKYRETRPDLDRVFENIKSFLPKVEKLNLFNLGEPLLHEGFCDFVKKCRRESETLNMWLCTNGMLMDEKISRRLIEEKLNTVTVSIHGGPGTESMLKYSKYGADYDKVLANIKQLTDLRSSYKSALPKVQIKTVLFDWNDTDELMDRLRRDAKAVGADLLYWILDRETGGLEHSSKRFTMYSKDLGELIRRGEEARTCRIN